ncbi:MAG: nucleotidyltransferase [Deltaproteobacteria bacterium]|nr:nucleotidyltransferase [Deltaproteobacteria bacterium]MBW1910147.1 nucleotidyltransferase [Deltaproteobacteria bacterium]MBW2114461.1 nucleotidyltransferase [Deltaproteobacteria bacterium]MBW2170145.1 nucleotidyltransferase [Deltaproteobacteria bacterium]MBW2357995.1 nucleotidyltransferase [Deltaproteobacteria bacterium]
MFKKLLSGISERLDKHGLPYMIVGGQAVLYYGEPRLTRDIDITLGVGIDHLENLLSVVRELSLKPLPEDIETFVRQTMVLPALDETTGIRVDFIFSFTPYETGAINRARKVRVMNQEVNFASVEDLIIHKIFAGRARDMEDVRTVLMKNSEIDIRYIKSWLKEFDESSEKKDFVKTFETLLKEL